MSFRGSIYFKHVFFFCDVLVIFRVYNVHILGFDSWFSQVHDTKERTDETLEERQCNLTYFSSLLLNAWLQFCVLIILISAYSNPTKLILNLSLFFKISLHVLRIDDIHNCETLPC